MRWSDISAQTTPPNVLKLNDFSNLPAVQSSPVNLKKSRISEWWNRTHVLRDPMINNVTDITLPSILHSQLEIIKPSRAEAMFPGVLQCVPQPAWVYILPLFVSTRLGHLFGWLGQLFDF